MEVITYGTVHENPVGIDAGLASIAELDQIQVGGRLVEVGVGKDDEGRVPAQLHGEAAHPFSAAAGQELSNFSRAGEREARQVPVGEQGVADLSGRPCEYQVDHALRETSLGDRLEDGQCCQRGLLGGLDDHRATWRRVAAAALRMINRAGKFHGVMATTGPTGRCTTI